MLHYIEAETIKLFNEEGAILIRKKHVRCCVATPDSTQINNFAVSIGGGYITKKLQYETNLYVWNISGKYALVFLTKIFPYLTGRRKEQAQKALDVNL